MQDACVETGIAPLGHEVIAREIELRDVRPVTDRQRAP